MKITIMKQKFMNVEEEAAQDKEDKATAMKEYIAMVVITLISYYVYYMLWLG